MLAAESAAMMAAGRPEVLAMLSIFYFIAVVLYASIITGGATTIPGTAGSARTERGRWRFG